MAAPSLAGGGGNFTRRCRLLTGAGAGAGAPGAGAPGAGEVKDDAVPDAVIGAGAGAGAPGAGVPGAGEVKDDAAPGAVEDEDDDDVLAEAAISRSIASFHRLTYDTPSTFIAAI